MRKLLFIILFSSSLIIAKAQNQAGSSTNNATTKAPQLVIISLKITAAGNQYTVALTNNKIINGTQTFGNTGKNWIENDFIGFILDAGKQTLDTIVVSQPLKVRYEYPKDDGSIGSKVVNLSENVVLLRFKYTATMKYLRVAKALGNGELMMIDTLELNQSK
ncbi:MAG: hypothetical protein V4635_00035 [Bacteroidota bacterium]